MLEVLRSGVKRGHTMQIALINDHFDPKLTMYPPQLPLSIVYLGALSH